MGKELRLPLELREFAQFGGLVGEAGVVLGKFGQDAKPFVDIMKEIVQIIWRTQATAEELPSGTNIPTLGN